MTEVFVDSSYWLALLHVKDALHEQAALLPRPARQVISSAIQLEVMNALSAPRLRLLAVHFWTMTAQDPDIVVIPLSGALLDRAFILYEQRPDKEWSMTDCISFTIMQERGIKDAFTADRHFEQAGFRALLRTP
jgi:predicted nucleic acid-binding protein